MRKHDWTEVATRIEQCIGEIEQCHKDTNQMLVFEPKIDKAIESLKECLVYSIKQIGYIEYYNLESPEETES